MIVRFHLCPDLLNISQLAATGDQVEKMENAVNSYFLEKENLRYNKAEGKCDFGPGKIVICA